MKRHPTKKFSQAPTQKNTITPGVLADPERLILVARNHYATGFPNVRRVDCPAPNVILAARANQMPGEEIRAHLFRCSECFNEYREAMRDRSPQSANPTASVQSAKLTGLSPRWRMPALAFVTSLLLIVAGLFVWRSHRSAAPQLSQDRPQRAPEASAEKPLTPPKPLIQPLTQPSQDSANSESEKPRMAGALAINLDLRQREALGDFNRGGTLREAVTKITLPRRRTVLKMKLRKGSAAGVYNISIVDPNSNPLLTTSARSRDGNSLEAVLDLRQASPMAHRLRIEHGDDLNEYLIEITIH